MFIGSSSHGRARFSRNSDDGMFRPSRACDRDRLHYNRTIIIRLAYGDKPSSRYAFTLGGTGPINILISFIEGLFGGY